MNEPLSRYNVTVTVGCGGGYLPDPAAFATAADQAAWSRSASIISVHLADKIISVVTVNAPDLYAAAVVARAVVSSALKHQALSFSQPTHDRIHHRTEFRHTARRLSLGRSAPARAGWSRVPLPARRAALT